MNKFLILVVLPLVFVSKVYAACEETDPCAPKKVKDAWQKSVAFGLNVTSGNSDTTLVTLLAAVAKETDQDISNINLSYNFGEDKNKTNEDGSNTTRNDITADAAYNYKLTPDWYIGMGSKYYHDEISEIDYRVNLNPTVGNFLVKNADVSFALEGGPGYTFEKVDDVSDDYFSPRLADRFEWIISCTSKIFQKAEILFDINDSENYIMNAEAGIEAAINSQLSLVLSVKDLYDNQPADDVDPNDLQLLTALKVAL